MKPTVKDSTAMAAELVRLGSDTDREVKLREWGLMVARDQRYLCVEKLQEFLLNREDISKEVAYSILSTIQNVEAPIK
jgi:hypothetical protein